MDVDLYELLSDSLSAGRRFELLVSTAVPLDIRFAIFLQQRGWDFPIMPTANQRRLIKKVTLCNECSKNGPGQTDGGG